MSLAADLRHLADVIDANPELDLHFASGAQTVYLSRSGPFADRVRLLAKFGTVAKERGADFYARVRLSPSFELCAIDYDGEVACELVQVGTEERPIMVASGRVEVVPVYEWKCPESILASAS